MKRNSIQKKKSVRKLASSLPTPGSISGEFQENEYDIDIPKEIFDNNSEEFVVIAIKSVRLSSGC